MAIISIISWESTYEITCSLNGVKANRDHALFWQKATVSPFSLSWYHLGERRFPEKIFGERRSSEKISNTPLITNIENNLIHCTVFLTFNFKTVLRLLTLACKWIARNHFLINVCSYGTSVRPVCLIVMSCSIFCVITLCYAYHHICCISYYTMCKMMRSGHWKRVKIVAIIWTLLQCSLPVSGDRLVLVNVFICSNLFCCSITLSSG